jgi:hypothetical protein
MTTTEDIIEILFARANAGPLKDAITGTVCKRKRDGNSSTEDVVINCLPVNAEQLQNGIANVNIHVPDVTVNINGIDQKQPNSVRLQQLAGIAVPHFTDVWASGYNYTVQQQTVFEDQEAGDHYINLRIEFFIENL